MDVSQFLKSFKKNVAAKAKRVSSTAPSTSPADLNEIEELSDLLYSDSDQETEAPSADYVVAGRADRLSERLYGAHQKRNQEFDALNVLSTNASAACEPGRALRHRAVVGAQLPDVRKRPRAELIASVRADLLRQRAQLKSIQASAAAVAAEAAPVAQVTATMVQVDDLLAVPSAAPASNNADSVATLLNFLPPTAATVASPLSPSSSSPPSFLLTTATVKTVVDTTEQTPRSAASAASGDVLHQNAAPPLTSTSSPVRPATEKEVPPLPKKRTKFEVAMTMVKGDDDNAW